MKRRTTRWQILLGAVACQVSGCSLVVPGCDYGLVGSCVVDPTLIVVDAAASPTVPDQKIPGCFNVLISRTYLSDSERELIQRAEDLASTAGRFWFNETVFTVVEGENYVVADAVTSEALAYYAKRALRFQTATTAEYFRVYLNYTARLLGERRGDLYYYNGALYGPTVRLQLQYGEGYGYPVGVAFTAWREVVFDQAGAIIQIRGDGKTSFPMARVLNSD
jgi:hypothetical protein